MEPPAVSECVDAAPVVDRSLVSFYQVCLSAVIWAYTDIEPMHYRFDSYHSSQFIFTLQHRTPPHRLCDFFFPLQLSINAFDYNCHVDLIKLLKQEGELVRLRKARQKMSELFPLTEGWCMSKYDFRVSWQQLCVICNNNNIFFFKSCRDLARLAEGWDPSDWGGAKPGESLWTFWEGYKRLHLWVHLNRCHCCLFDIQSSHDLNI